MPDQTTEQQGLQDQIAQQMKDFVAENPDIGEAMAVMNMTMPDYYLAMESIRGDRVISASVYVPVQIHKSS